MLSQRAKVLLEGFLTGAAAASLLYTLALNAGWIVNEAGVRAIAQETIKPIQSNVDSILVLSLEARIRDLTQEMCTASRSLRVVLQNEIDGLQKQHLELVKSYYTVTVKCDSPPV